MVVDTLDNLEKYVSLNPLFADVVKFIKENDLSKLEDGKHFIKESNLFVNITTAHGKSEEDAVLETHRKMIDIQIPLDNEETYGYTPLADLPEVEYNEAKQNLFKAQSGELQAKYEYLFRTKLLDFYKGIPLE
jgi:YhcH/YjgK/YiaL family protein